VEFGTISIPKNPSLFNFVKSIEWSIRMDVPMGKIKIFPTSVMNINFEKKIDNVMNLASVFVITINIKMRLCKVTFNLIWLLTFRIDYLIHPKIKRITHILIWEQTLT
jgi:hypothetical protein